MLKTPIILISSFTYLICQFLFALLTTSSSQKFSLPLVLMTVSCDQWVNGPSILLKHITFLCMTAQIAPNTLAWGSSPTTGTHSSYTCNRLEVLVNLQPLALNPWLTAIDVQVSQLLHPSSKTTLDHLSILVLRFPIEVKL
jgi:hypothetical protein